jgi:hypothetical protein
LTVGGKKVGTAAMVKIADVTYDVGDHAAANRIGMAACGLGRRVRRFQMDLGRFVRHASRRRVPHCRLLTANVSPPLGPLGVLDAGGRPAPWIG